ncbi:MAG TPA: hypothetical protein VJ969_01270 [Desulfopila sp.]|nr:hypothetical protein [Desulfopila sp.]
MILSDIVLALVLGVLFAALFGAFARGRGGMPGIVPVFILFFLFAWAGGLWLRPVGPPVFGMYWVPGLILAVLIFLLLAAVVRRPTRTRTDVEKKLAVENAAATVIGITFWFLIGLLLLAILAGYMS